MKIIKIPEYWVPSGMSTSDLKVGDIMEFEMEPNDDWGKGKINIHQTPILFDENNNPCISEEFVDKYHNCSRYIRINQK